MNPYEKREDIPIPECECCERWPKVIADIYRRAVWDLGGDDNPLLWGPAHVVWEDNNFDCAESCLRDFDEMVQRLNMRDDFNEDQLIIVHRTLEELAQLPMSIRDGEVDILEDK